MVIDTFWPAGANGGALPPPDVEGADVEGVEVDGVDPPPQAATLNNNIDAKRIQMRDLNFFMLKSSFLFLFFTYFNHLPD
jgi:hypothetical protein